MNSPLDPRESLLRLGAQVLDAIYEFEKLEANLPHGALDYIRRVGAPPTAEQLEHFTDQYFDGNPVKTLTTLVRYTAASHKVDDLVNQYVTLRAALELNEAGHAKINPDDIMDMFGVDDQIRTTDPTPEDLKRCANPQRHNRHTYMRREDFTTYTCPGRRMTVINSDDVIQPREEH